MHLLPACPITSSKQTLAHFPVYWWIFVRVRRFEPYNIKPLRLFSTQVPRFWSMANSQDSEWSTDWTTSGIRMLNNCPLNRGGLWIIHQAAKCPRSHSDLPREHEVRAQMLGTNTAVLPAPATWENGKNNGWKGSKYSCEEM